MKTQQELEWELSENLRCLHYKIGLLNYNQLERLNSLIKEYSDTTSYPASKILIEPY